MFESTIHRLRIFQTVVETGSFNTAAKKLGITQPSISAHIHVLEQELGKSLFTRESGKKAQLTEAGKVFYDYTLDIVSKTTQVVLTLEKIEGKQKQVTIVAQPSIANIELPPYLAMFSKTYPEIDIVLSSQTIDIVLARVLGRKTELGLVQTIEPIEGVCSEVLSCGTLEFIVGTGHELAERTCVHVEELREYGFILGLKTSYYAKMADRALQKMGLHQYHLTAQIEDYKTIIEMTKQGIGITLLSSNVVEEDIRKGHLVKLPIQAEPILVELRLLWNKDVKLSDEAVLFMSYLRQVLKAST